MNQEFLKEVALSLPCMAWRRAGFVARLLKKRTTLRGVNHFRYTTFLGEVKISWVREYGHIRVETRTLPGDQRVQIRYGWSQVGFGRGGAKRFNAPPRLRGWRITYLPITAKFGVQPT